MHNVLMNTVYYLQVLSISCQGKQKEPDAFGSYLSYQQSCVLFLHADVIILTSIH